MKRFLGLLLVLSLVFALIGCGKKDALTITDGDKTVTLKVGDTKIITPTVTGDKTVVWSSSNNNIVTVSQSGVITAVEEGNATITVALKDTEISVEISVTVTRPKPESVTITGDGDVVVGQTLQLTGTVAPANAKQTLTWTSSKTSVATVDDKGLVTGVAAGETVITATSVDATVKKEVTIKVVLPNPTGITITGPKEVLLHESITLTATVAPALAAQGVVWTVSDSSIASITIDGVLTGLKGGTVNAIATSAVRPNISAQYAIKVNLPAPTAVTVSGPETVAKDMTANYKAVVEPADASQSVIWSVSDSAIATISENGVLTPVAEGTVIVTAKTAALDTILDTIEVTILKARINANMVMDGGYWPITGTDPFVNGAPVLTATLKAGLNPTSAEYYVAGDKSNHFSYIFIQDQNYKISPSVWQNRVFLNRNENGFFVAEKVLPAGSAYVNPTLSDYDYVIYAHEGNKAGYDFIGSIQVGQIVTLNGFDINAVTEFSIGEIVVNVYNPDQAVSTAELYGPGEEELVLPIPGKNGYLFDGWYENQDYSGNPVTKLTASQSVYAKWKLDYTYIAVNADATLVDGDVYYSSNAKKYFVKGETLFATLAEAIEKVNANGTIYVEAGEFANPATINKNGLSIIGAEGAIIKGKISVAANVDGLTIKNMKFVDAGSIELAAAGGIKNLTFENNIVTDMKTEASTFFNFKNDGTAVNKDFVFKGNKFLLGEGKAARWIRGGNVENLTITDNVFEGKPGVYVDAVRIEGSNEANTASVGVAGTVTITNNQFNNVGQRGVWLRRISATKIDVINNIFDHTGGETAGGGLQLEAIVPDTVLEVNIQKNTFQNITHYFGIKLGTAEVPTIGEITITENKFINFTLADAPYIVAYEGVTKLDANGNFYEVAPNDNTMDKVPTDAYAESYTVLKVTFDSQKGSTVADYDVPVALERKAVKPTDPTRLGYKFEGWFKEAAGKTAFDFDNEVINYPVTVYAKWTPVEYNVTYNIDGGEFGLAFANRNEMVDAFMEDLYTFINPTESKSEFFHGVDKTSGYDGLWINNETYKAKIYNGTRPTAPNNDYFISHEDYMEKWLPFFDNMEAFIQAVNNTQHFWGGTSVGLIRIRQYVMNVKPATYVTDETMAMMPAQYKLATKYTIENEYPLVAPTKEGRIFAGWYDNAEFKGEPVTKIEKGTTGDLQFYAKWIYSVTVSYKEVDGTPIVIQPVIKGSILEQPADPTKLGYKFVAWFTDPELTTEFTFGEKALEDITLYAKWDEIVYDLVFELNEGTWSWTTGEVTTPEKGIADVSNLPVIFMQDFYAYLKNNNLLRSEKVASKLQVTNWVDFSKDYDDPVAIYNHTSTGFYSATDGYSQLFWDSISGNNDTKEITEVVGGFFGTEPYKTKYANLLSHMALLVPQKYESLNLWTDDTAKSAMGFVLDGFFYGTQGPGSGKMLALRSAIPTPTAKFAFDGDNLTTVATTYQVMTNKVTVAAKLLAPSRVGYVFEGWYTTADFSGNKVESIPVGSIPAAKYYAKWKNISYDEVNVKLELNGGFTGTYVEATRYSTAGDSAGARITVGTSRGGLYWYVIGVKPTETAGFYEVVGKGTGYTDANATLYISYHDKCTSQYKTTLANAYKNIKAGDLVFIGQLPSAVAADTSIDVYLNASTAAITTKMNLPGDFPTLSRDGYTFAGWYDNAEFTGEPYAQYPGFEGIELGDITFYAKWTK